MFKLFPFAVLALLAFTALPLDAASTSPFNSGPKAQTVQSAKAKQKDPQFLLAQAKAKIEANQWLEAEKLLKKAKKLDPEIAEVYKLLGDFHTAFNRDWKAKKLYKKAEALEAAKKQ